MDVILSGDECFLRMMCLLGEYSYCTSVKLLIVVDGAQPGLNTVSLPVINVDVVLSGEMDFLPMMYLPMMYLSGGTAMRVLDDGNSSNYHRSLLLLLL